VYFYPAKDFFSQIKSGSFLDSSGFFFGFTKLFPNESKIESTDLTVRNTIIKIVEEEGKDKNFFFHCDDGDGKKSKRAIIFDKWFKSSIASSRYKKLDEQIILFNSQGNQDSTEYISLIIERNNSNIEHITIEFQLLKEDLI